MRLSVRTLCVVWMVAAVSGFAQSVAGQGGISGAVRDATGAVAPGARVQVVNDGKGIRRALESNEAGVFAAPALVPSTGYAVMVYKDGFTPYEARNIEVLVGQNVSLNVVLQVAAAATLIEVSEMAPIVEQTKTGVSQVVVSAQIQELPINGRRVGSFVPLTPAVVPDGTNARRAQVSLRLVF